MLSWRLNWECTLSQGIRLCWKDLISVLLMYKSLISFLIMFILFSPSPALFCGMSQNKSVLLTGEYSKYQDQLACLLSVSSIKTRSIKHFNYKIMCRAFTILVVFFQFLKDSLKAQPKNSQRTLGKIWKP